MIVGTGCDIVQIPRIKETIEKYGNKFLNRVFTKNEIELGEKIANEKIKISYYAKRFAAKEAFSKAISEGIGKNIAFIDIEIVKEESGQPNIILSKTSQNFIEKKYNSKISIFLSLADDYPVAQAFVIIQKGLI